MDTADHDATVTIPTKSESTVGNISVTIGPFQTEPSSRSGEATANNQTSQSNLSAEDDTINRALDMAGLVQEVEGRDMEDPAGASTTRVRK